jgi:hypothetical protein
MNGGAALNGCDSKTDEAEGRMSQIMRARHNKG